MGDFSVTCGMTGISLMGDKVALIPLVPRKGGAEYDRCGAMIVSNEGAYAFYTPFALPVFGTLDSYGRLEDIEEDFNTRFIEKKTGLPIDKFCELCSYGNVHGDKASPAKLESVLGGSTFAGMIVHREAWDRYTRKAFSDGDGSNDWSMWDHMSGFPEAALEMLGFTFEGETDRERYNRKYVTDLLPELVAYTDGSFTQFEVIGKKDKKLKLESVFSVRDLDEGLKKHDLELPGALAHEAKKTCRMIPQLIHYIGERHCSESFEQLLKFYGDEIAKYESRPEDLAEAKKLRLPMEEVARFHRRERKAVPGPFLDRMAELYSFTNNMFDMNKVLGPTHSGPQYGNHFAVRDLARLTEDITTRRIREMED